MTWLVVLLVVAAVAGFAIGYSIGSANGRVLATRAANSYLRSELDAYHRGERL